MKTVRGLAPILLAAALAPPIHAADLPTAEEIVNSVVAAAGGQEAFNDLGVLQVPIQEEETTGSGETTLSKFTGYLDSNRLDYLRLDMPDDVIVAANPGGGGWASQKGKIDDRPQAPRLAAGTARQKLFPLMLPFSLAMNGITYGEVHEGEFEGQKVWYVTLIFDKLFFASAIMQAPWYLTVRESDNALLSVEFLPPVEFRNVQSEGVRYRYMKYQELGGVKLPAQILMEGINTDYQPTGHFRVTKLSTQVRGPFEPTLFINPDKLEALENAIPGLDTNDDEDPGPNQE